MFDDMKLSGIELECDDGISKENKAVNNRNNRTLDVSVTILVYDSH